MRLYQIRTGAEIPAAFRSVVAVYFAFPLGPRSAISGRWSEPTSGPTQQREGRQPGLLRIWSMRMPNAAAAAAAAVAIPCSRIPGRRCRRHPSMPPNTR